MSKIIVTIKHTIPLMDYGNTIFEATQEIETDATGHILSGQTVVALQNLKSDVGDVILPLVESEVQRCMSVLTKPMESTPDNWMRRNSKIYQWFRLAYPDVEIPAMANLLAPANINRGAASLKGFDRDGLEAYKDMK